VPLSALGRSGSGVATSKRTRATASGTAAPN